MNWPTMVDIMLRGHCNDRFDVSVMLCYIGKLQDD